MRLRLLLCVFALAAEAVPSVEESWPKTVHNMYKLLRAIVGWHHKQNDQPPRKWSPDLPPLKENEQRWFTPIEIQQIVSNAEGQYKVLFHLAASTGMRAGEYSPFASRTSTLIGASFASDAQCSVAEKFQPKLRATGKCSSMSTRPAFYAIMLAIAAG